MTLIYTFSCSLKNVSCYRVTAYFLFLPLSKYFVITSEGARETIFFVLKIRKSVLHYIHAFREAVSFLIEVIPGLGMRIYGLFFPIGALFINFAPASNEEESGGFSRVAHKIHRQ